MVTFPAYRLGFLFVLFAASSVLAREQGDAANSRIHEIAQNVSKAFYKECLNEPLEEFSVTSRYVDVEMNIPMIESIFFKLELRMKNPKI